SMETLTMNDNDKLFESVQHLELCLDQSVEERIDIRDKYPNVSSLKVYNYHDTDSLSVMRYLSHLLIFSNLKHLQIYDTSGLEGILPPLLEMAPNLNSLDIHYPQLVIITDQFNNFELCTLLNSQIRHLVLLN
ncbi:unnamed protein product, partial [Didymodactylos carnosus]